MANFRKRWRSLAAAGIVAGVVAAAVGVGTSPAAAVSGLTLVRSTTVGPPGGLYFSEVSCPPGTRRTGGGARASSASIHIGVSRPSSEPGENWWSAGLGSTSPTASMTAYGICASTLSGYEMVMTEALPGAGAFMAVATLSCPAGKRVIGAGGSHAGQRGYVLDGIFIAPDLTGIVVRTLRTPFATPDTSPYAVAFAICVNPVPGQQRVMAATETSTGLSKSVSVNCPFGTRLHGLGGMLGGGAGQVGFQAMNPTSSFNRTLAGATVTARVLAGTNYQGAWRAEVYGVCAL
ncbi:MAG TPA: hypothetical protein VF062_12120 [Candidatus Limnocylindrales bacterium]